MTLKDLLVGKKVRATQDCNSAKKGKIYEVKLHSNGDDLLIGEEGSVCNCAGTWELVEKLTYTPSKHKHIYPKQRCETCGEVKK